MGFFQLGRVSKSKKSKVIERNYFISRAFFHGLKLKYVRHNGHLGKVKPNLEEVVYLEVGRPSESGKD